MPLPYKRHFPEDWSDDKIQECAWEISTDPKNRWQQITGQNTYFPSPHKFLVDGSYSGQMIRIILEPDDRGILAVYPLRERGKICGN